MNTSDSYEELLYVAKKRKIEMEAFIKFLHTDANIDKETISKISTDLISRRYNYEINELDKMTL